MTHNLKIVAVLDTNIIYPIEIRDLLFWLAHYELFEPKWTKHILYEWQDVMISKGVPKEEAIRRSNVANFAFPAALVAKYNSLITMLTLPDEKDRHVLAAAIRAKASVIVTNNLKDFPNEYLATFGIIAMSADNFIFDLVTIDPTIALEAFVKLVLNRRNPNLNADDVLINLRRNGLIKSATVLQELIKKE